MSNIADPLVVKRALRHLRRADGRLPSIMQVSPRPQFKPSRNHLQSLTRAIIYQQLSGKAAGTIYRRFLAIFGGRFPTAAAILQAPPAQLRAAGLSAAKAEFVRDLARHVADGLIDVRRLRRLDDDQVVGALTRVKGIGVWSVHMFLLFGLNRPDVLPVGDLGVRRGMQRLYGLAEMPGPAAMESLALSWRPYRSIGSWYMWRAAELGT